MASMVAMGMARQVFIHRPQYQPAVLFVVLLKDERNLDGKG